MSVAGLGNLPLAIYLSAVETPPISSDDYFMFIQFEVWQAQVFSAVPASNKSVGSYTNELNWNGLPSVNNINQYEEVDEK